MDLGQSGKPKALARARAALVRELSFTEAYQTWTKEAQQSKTIEAAIAALTA